MQGNGKPRANASKNHQEQPKSNSHLTQKAQETQAPEGNSFALRLFGSSELLT
jgi:hypothetical protein